MKSPLRFLSTKLFLLLLGVMIVIFGIHTYLSIKTTSSNLTEMVYSSAGRASDLIVRSTRYGMLLNRKEDVHETIRTVGSLPGFVEINIYDKSGEVIFSTDSTKIGNTVDLDAEACNICHAAGSPLVSVPTESRVRVYGAAAQGRILGLINPIHNEPDCSTAACHAHPESQTVLGVLDVKMSLASVDERVKKAKTALVASSAGMTLLIATISGLFIYGMVRQPIRRLVKGMRRISSGDLTTRIDIDSGDEIAELARSFNTMADDLRTAQRLEEQWAQMLEERIEQKTGELKDAQTQVIHMEKMASLGKLSASIAHEINNPLFGILMYAKLGLRELGDGDDNGGTDAMIKKYLSIIRAESSRVGDIVKNLLAFARNSGGEFESHHLNEIVEQTLAILRHHFELKQIAVRPELMSGDDTIVCDRKQIQQAIIAPCINSVEAMPRGGTLTIGTEGAEDFVTIRIVDTGVGIPRESLPRIFEPFFTTKDGESGLGLGLSVAYGIVQRHQGTFEVKSNVGKGTVLTMTLPRHPRPDADEERGEGTESEVGTDRAGGDHPSEDR